MNDSVKNHGKPPFSVVLIHGGPGAAGELTPLAMELAKYTSLIEPFQTKSSIRELVRELDDQVSRNAETPVVLVGHSWGAWLSFLYASEYSLKVRKLILISSGPFSPRYAADIINVRVQRLPDNEKKILFRLIERLNEPEEENKNVLFREVGELINRADSFESIEVDTPEINYDYNTYLRIWNEAQALRETGGLLDAANGITCPVIAIHGDYDPHPAEGVRDPLSPRIKDFSFHLIRNCGHHPWEEKLARDEFFNVLLNHIFKP